MRKDIEKRTNKYSINERLERVIRELNDSVKDLEKKEISKLTDSSLPLLFFCCAPRTGATLISQVFAHTQEMAYISNYTARFWEAPYLALLLEKELGLRRLIEENTSNNGYSSEYGVTKNVFEPHEFGFFWNKYIPYRANETHFVEEKAFTKNITSGLYREIMAMLSVNNKPFFFKNAIAGLNCHYIKNVFPNSFFIIVKRDYRFVAQSIVEGRRNLYGSEDSWFSLRPSRYKEIIANYNNPYDQIALQIKGIYDDTSRGTEDIKDRCLELYYEDFCRTPAKYLSDIFSLIGHKPENDSWIEKIPDQIEVRNEIRLAENEYNGLCSALKKHDIGENCN
jgi:hypothetical protein